MEALARLGFAIVRAPAPEPPRDPLDHARTLIAGGIRACAGCTSRPSASLPTCRLPATPAIWEAAKAAVKALEAARQRPLGRRERVFVEVRATDDSLLEKLELLPGGDLVAICSCHLDGSAAYQNVDAAIMVIGAPSYWRLGATAAEMKDAVPVELLDQYILVGADGAFQKAWHQGFIRPRASAGGQQSQRDRADLAEFGLSPVLPKGSRLEDALQAAGPVEVAALLAAQAAAQAAASSAGGTAAGRNRTAAATAVTDRLLDDMAAELAQWPPLAATSTGNGICWDGSLLGCRLRRVLEVLGPREKLAPAVAAEAVHAALTRGRVTGVTVFLVHKKLLSDASAKRKRARDADEQNKE